MYTDATLTIVLLMTFYTLYKVRKIHLMQFAQKRLIQTATDNLYSQLQSYVDLQGILRLHSAMPGLRGWAASPDFLLTVVRHTISRKPMVIVECSSGASTLALAKCCMVNGKGHVYSLEHDHFYAETSRQLLHSAGLSDFATVVDAPLADVEIAPTRQWYSLHNLIPLLNHPVELLVIDGPPMDTGELARYPALPLMWDHLADDFTAILDDSDRPSEQTILSRWKSEFNNLDIRQLPLEKGAAILRREISRDTRPAG